MPVRLAGPVFVLVAASGGNLDDCPQLASRYEPCTTEFEDLDTAQDGFETAVAAYVTDCQARAKPSDQR